MTLKEKILAAYRHDPGGELLAAIYSRYLARGRLERSLRELGLGIIDFYPPVSMLAPPWHILPGLVSEVRGASLEVRFDWVDHKLTETRTYVTPVGTIRQESVTDPSYGSAWIQKFYIQEPRDYRTMQYVVENTIFVRQEAAIRERISDLGEDGLVMARVDRCAFQKLLIELAGAERFLMDLYSEPEPVVELLEAIERKQDEAFAMSLDTSAEVIWQPDNLSADMTPPKCFRQYLLPVYERRSKMCRERGKLYIVHMDGRLRPLKDLIARAPIDVIESFSFPEVGGDLDLKDARAAWTGKAIVPNLPASLCYRGADEMGNFVDQVLAGSGGGAAMIEISEDIPRAEWQRALPLLCDAIRRRRHTTV